MKGMNPEIRIKSFANKCKTVPRSCNLKKKANLFVLSAAFRVQRISMEEAI